MGEITARIYFYTLLLLAIYAAFRFNKVDKATRILCVWIWLGILTELIGNYAAINYGNNLAVYTFSCILEFVLIAMYFHFSLFRARHQKTAIVIAIIGTVAGIGNSLFLQPLGTLNSNFLLLECLGVVCLCLYSMHCRLLKSDSRPIDEFHFLVPCIFLLYQCGALWNWGFFHLLDQMTVEGRQLWYISLLLVNTLTYLAFGWILFNYTKFRRTNV